MTQTNRSDETRGTVVKFARPERSRIKPSAPRPPRMPRHVPASGSQSRYHRPSRIPQHPETAAAWMAAGISAALVLIGLWILFGS